MEAGQRSKQGGGELEKEWMGRERERGREDESGLR